MNSGFTDGPTRWEAKRENGPPINFSIISKRLAMVARRKGDEWKNPFFPINTIRIDENYIIVGVQPTMNQLVVVYLENKL